IAGALQDLEAVHALVVHGAGMDEISPFGETHLFEVRGHELTEWTIDPRRFGYGSGSVDEVVGGPPAENAAAVVRTLRGEANPPSMAAVILNAAAALYV